MRPTTSIGNSRKSLTKHLRRTFWLYKGIEMLKLEGMHRQTGEEYVSPTAMLRQIREVSDFQNLQPFNNLVLTNTLRPHKASRK